MHTSPDSVVAPPMLSDLVPVSPGRRVIIEDVVELVHEDVVVVKAAQLDIPNPLATTAVEDWDWQQLRDYVVSQIQRVSGVFPRDDKKEMGIFKAFMSRHPGSAVAIARFAFETAGGYWKNAPISVNRFCKNSDPYFADPIAAHLAEAAAARAAQA